MIEPNELVLGIDGGGTKTEVWLAYRSQPQQNGVVGKGRGQTSNPRSVTFDQAIGHLDQAIDAAFANAGLPRRCVAAACIGLAGADRDEEQQRLRTWAHQVNLAQKITLTNDALPLLHAAAPDGVGIALIAGTGSLCLGRNPDGRLHRCGGWGPVMGDEGSGYWIACQGLRAVAAAADHRGEPTALLDLFVRHFRRSTAQQLIPIIYQTDMERAEIAALAPLVFAAQAQGDAVASAIIERSADELAQLVTTVAETLSFTPAAYRLSLSGGVLTRQPQLCQRLEDRLSARSLRPAETFVVEHPVVGSLVLAANAASTGNPD
ncbi:MAG: N-acetylglucosamine kinase [Pirellulales bacterium]|nr:N-acetylglucosamine kinase [Pirellulales bacterium]